jgi:pimeloyl-ACP methyl ester carboxylesterase
MTAVSEELFAEVSTGGERVTLCYQTFGSPDGEPLLLVMGLGGPMTWWDIRLCTLLAESGFYVIRYDNRDIGRSSRLSGRVSRVQLAKAFLGLRVTPPYTIGDMAADAVGLLDALGVEQAHVCGMSMGGMIVQTLAVEHPDRVRSVVSVMSTTGKRSVGWQHPSILPVLLKPARGRAEYVKGGIAIERLIGSPGFPADDEATRQRLEETWDRGIWSSGVARQMLAVLTQPDRTAGLRKVGVPFSVVHGLADKMVHVSGGRATSMAVPGAELLLIQGMGHDLPEPLWPTFLRIIKETAARAQRPD